MKKVLALALFIISVQTGISQELDVCRSIVNLTMSSIQDQSIDQIENHLSPDFTIAQQKGTVAKMVLSQLFQQLNENVLSFKEIEHINTDRGLDLKYEVNYESMGVKEATFTFDAANKLEELHLFKMEVKKMDASTKVIDERKEIVQIPFKMLGNLIGVEVLLNNEKKLFILDTGSPKVILNSKYVPIEKNKVKRTISSTKGVGGNISGMDIHQLEKLDFYGLKIEDLNVLSVDLSHLEDGSNHEIHGLIGFEMIKNHDLLFDYENQILTMIDPNLFESFKAEHWDGKRINKVPFTLNGHIPVVECKIAGKTYNLGIDSGAESHLIDDSLLPIMENEIIKKETEVLRGADKNVKEVLKVVLKTMQLANTIFKDQTTLISDISHLNTAYGLTLDGILGFPILSQQKTLISFQREEIIFID